MVGDVNIYMNDLDDPQMAEVEIMIAELKRYTCFYISDLLRWLSMCVTSWLVFLLLERTLSVAILDSYM